MKMADDHSGGIPLYAEIKSNDVHLDEKKISPVSYNHQLMTVIDSMTQDAEKDVDAQAPNLVQKISASVTNSPSLNAVDAESKELCEVSSAFSFDRVITNASCVKRTRGRPRKDCQRPIKHHLGQSVASKVFPGRPRFRGRKFQHFLMTHNPRKNLQDMSSVLDVYEDIDSDLKPACEVPEKILLPSEIIPDNELKIEKFCSLCNLSEKSLLGQGKLKHFKSSEGFHCFEAMSQKTKEKSLEVTTSESGGELKLFFKKQKLLNCSGEPLKIHRSKSLQSFPEKPSLLTDLIQELELTGFKSVPESSDIFEQSGELYAHFNCAAWSEGVTKTFEKLLSNVDKAVVAAAFQKCSKCGRFGASVRCCVSDCTKIYHYPCAIVSGALQNANCFKIICSIHLEDAFSFGVICMACHESGDLSMLLLCTSCSNYYHGNCMDPPITPSPDVRAGWQCLDCKVCQNCRQPDDSSKMIVCNTCDKGYHTFCVKPAVASVPKSGWKCSACRMCGDCGARTPGNGPSSRWHLNYSVCDSCYQQRNKGIACPLCGKAYRQFSQKKVMKHCTVCQKYIHEECDKRVRRNSMDYVCPICTASEGKHLDGTVVDLTIKDNCSSRDSFLSGNEESLSSESEDGTIDGVPAKISHRRTSSNELRHKKSPKPKYKAFSIPNFLYSMSAAVSQKDYKMDDDDPTEDNKLILASATDEFVLCQDLCVMCGSFGRGEEGRLICCAQCGQCYHSYCVSVKVTTVVLKKGWRCLDCTVCEGCGQPHDEGRLLLCDECDISFHIYCLDPPLQEVPQGNWKCKWCVNCIKCGSKSPGLNCDWQVNYTLCGPCGSFTVCCLCQQRYEDTELIIQCSRCERWLHGLCDQMETEDDAEKCAEYGYTCPHCRSPDELPPHLLPPPRTPTPEIEPVIEKHASPVAKPKDPEPPVVKSKPPVQYFLDGVCLSESGLQYIKSLSPEQPKKIPRPRKIKQISDSVRSFSFLDRSNEDSTSAGATEDTKMDAATLEELAMKAYDFEEGKMVVDGSKEEDKKKRPRKLQKLGIGGFSVKPRGRLSTGKDSAVDSAEVIMTPVTDSISSTLSSEMSTLTADGPESNSLDKPKRKRKPKKKTHLDESFPVYLRDAFFGKDLLLSCKKLAKSEVAEVVADAKTGEPTKVNLDPNTSADSKASIRLQEDTKDFLPTSGLAKSKDASAANIVYKSLIKSEIESIKEEHLSSTSMETSAYPGSFGTSKSSALYTSQAVGPSVMSNLHHPDSNSSWPDSDCDQSHMQKNILKWESDEHLGLLSTISPVLYANINLPHLKIEFPAWVDRVKQIAKIWRGLPPEKRQPYLQRARENRAASRTSQRSNSSDLDKSQKEVRTPSDVDPEKQWKQFQAMRQLQHQAQQRLLQEQRTQAAMKSQVEKPIGSPAVADMDKNLKLFHSKSMSEIPQFPSLATDDGPSKEGAHKIFEKRWSSSALDLNAAHTVVQGNKLKMEMPVSSQPSFIKDNIQSSPLMSGRTPVYGPRVLGGSPSMEPQLSIPDASVPSTGIIKSSDHLLRVSPSSSQSISQITNSPVPVLAGKDEVPRVSSVAQKENSMVTPPATPRPHSSDSFFQMTSSPQSQLLASLDSHSQPTPARTPTTYEMTKSSSSVVQSTPNFNMGNKVGLQPSTSSPKSSLQPPAQQFVLHQGSLTPANIAKQLSQYKETFGSISSTQAAAKTLLSPQQEKPIEQQNLEQFLTLPYSGKVNQHQQLRDLLQNKDRSNEGNTHLQATNQSQSLPGSIAVSSTSTSTTTAVSSTSHITSSTFSNNQTSQALSDNRQQQTILNRFTDSRQQQILVDNRYNDSTQQQTAVDNRFIDNKQQQQTAVDNRFIDNKQQQQSVSNRFNDNKQQISVDSSLQQASVDNRFQDGRQQQTSVNRLSDDRKQQSSVDSIFHDSRQQQSSIDNRINDGRQQQPSVDNRQMQSSVENRFNEGRQQQALADSRFNDNRQQQTSVDNRFSDGRQQQTSVENRFSENRQQHAIVDSRLHDNRQQQTSVENRFNNTQQQTSIDNRQQQASVDNRFNTNRQQQASIDNRQQQVPIDSRQQQVSIDNRQQQGPIDSRQHPLSNDNRQQQAPIDNGQQQAAIDNKQQISIENGQEQASIDDRQQTSIDNIQQASIDNIQQTSIDNKQQLQASIDNRSQQACIDNRFNENRQQHAPEHQQITVERVPQSSLEKDLMVDNGNEKRASTSVVEDVCLPILDSKDDPKDEACPDLNKKRKTTAGDLVKDLETEPEEHDVIAANCSLYALSADVGELELDDEELLGLGNDFNILEYADPELDKSLVGEGDKNNILDEHLDLDDKDEELEEDVIKDGSQEKDLISQEMSDKKAIEIAKENCKEPDKGSDLPENFLDFDKKNIDSRFESSFQPKGLDSDNPSHEALSTVKEEPKQAFSSCSLSPQTYSPSINIKLEKTTPENCPKSHPMSFGNESQGINSSRIQCPTDSGVPPPSYRMVTALKQTLSSHQGPLMQSKGMFPLHLNLSQQVMDTTKPLLLQEQPLLLAELVEQEKREQRRQTQEGLISPHGDALLSDIDFERLKDDVFSGPPDDSLGAPGSLLGPHEPGAVSPSLTSSPSSHSFGPPPYSLLWQNQDSPGALAPRPVTSGFMQTVKKAPVSAVISQLGLPNAGLIQKAPNMPGVSIPTRPFNPHLVPSSPSIMDPEKLKLLNYEKQLLQQQALLSSQQKYVETEVIKLRKVKKALNAKQRQLRKNGAELAENDSLELARVSQEQAGLQKQLDQVRKQSRQNTVAIQDFRLKQQKKQQQPPPPPQPVPRSHPVVNSSPQSPLQFTHATPSSPSVRLHSPSHLMQPGTPLFSQQLQMPKQENTSWPSPLKMPPSDLQAADRFLKREQFDRNVSQTFPLSSSTQSPQADITLKSLMDIKKNLGEETFKPISGSAPHVPGESTEQQQSFSAKSVDTVQTPSLLKEPKIEAVSTAPSTVSQSILSQSLPSSVSNTLKFTLRQTGMPTGCLPTDATAENPNELGYGVDADLPPSKLCDGDPVVVLESKPETPRNENGIEVQTSAKSPDPKHNLIKQETSSNLHEESHRVKPDVKIEPNSEKNVPAETSVVGELLTHIKQEIMDDLPAENTNDAQTMSGECEKNLLQESGQKQKEDGHEGSSDEELEGMASKIPEAGGEQNVLLKQLLQNCPSAETRKTADDFIGLRKEGEEASKLELAFSVDDLAKAKMEDPKSKKPTYLDIRRAQLDKEPTPPPGEKPKAIKRKRPKKKKLEAPEGGVLAKKKCRRSSSKIEEGYETYVETLMNKLTSLPPLRILEPNIKPNFSAVPVFGAGDLNVKENQLKGSYGSATLPDQIDIYSFYPYTKEQPPISTILPPSSPPYRGFYNQEFPAIAKAFEKNEMSLALKPPLDIDHFKVSRDAGSPDTVISSSSPESCLFEPLSKWPKLIFVDKIQPESKQNGSPVIPLMYPVPLRFFPKEWGELDEDKDKENIPDDKMEMGLTKTKMSGIGGYSAPLKDSGNVAVTLTLSSAAAEDICGVLSALADLLKIPIPASYEIVERTATPPSQKLGLYRRSKNSEVSIHSLLNGKPRFCRHCDIVVLSAGIRKKASDLPCISKEEQEEEDEVIFCSTNCYMQFALTHRPTAILEEKEAAAVVDHIGESVDSKYLMGEDSLGALVMDEREELEEGDLKLPQDMEVDPSEENMLEALGDEKYLTSSNPYDIDLLNDKMEICDEEPMMRKWKSIKYKYWSSEGEPMAKPKRKEDCNEKVARPFYHTIKPSQMPKDERKCIFCHSTGDGDTSGAARLLNMDVNKWVHLNCALWSYEVYETVNGALMNVEVAFKRSRHLSCYSCHKQGASVRCFKTRCPNVYHFPCAKREHCAFFKDKTVMCPQHVHKGNPENQLDSTAVFRRVYINREEHKQVASMIQDEKYVMRVGSLIFLNIGQLLPTQIQAFHNTNCIYPVGYKVIRMYWSMRKLGRRSQYICTINEVSGKPEFTIQVKEFDQKDVILKDKTAKGVWQKVLYPIEKMRKQAKTIKIFPDFITGDDLFGLAEPAVLRIVESLPGVDTLYDYNFRYGRSPFLELPLAINPTGCARSEPKLRTHFKRSHTLHTSNTTRSFLHSAFAGFYPEVSSASSPYIKQFVHSKSSQYRKMKTEWRNNVYLARSRIQGLGLYAARDMEKHTMVIEYIGQLIRNEIAERNEAIYDAQNRGTYMFRLDENRVIDATMSGGLARYINHSCSPNCVTEAVQIDRENKIIIITNRRVTRGEELSYDYKFEVEDDQHKIPCLCGAPNCRKWMN